MQNLLLSMPATGDQRNTVRALSMIIPLRKTLPEMNCVDSRTLRALKLFLNTAELSKCPSIYYESIETTALLLMLHTVMQSL